MKNSIRKFLEFNGKVIYFLSKDGEYWIAIKPICEALGVDFERQRRRLNNDEILGQLPSIQTVVAADNKLRKMLCIPEKFVYGWIFSIQSSSTQLKEYKLECYNVLFDYFHGIIGSRQESLTTKADIQLQKKDLNKKLMEIPAFQKLMELQAEEMRLGKILKALDEKLISTQIDLFQS